MNPSTLYSQEIVMQELAKLSETQQEEVLSFIHSLTGNKSLIPQNFQEVPSTGSAQSGSLSRRNVIASKAKQSRANRSNPRVKPQQAPSDESFILIALKQFPEEKQQRLNFLAEKNTEGTITKEELSEFEELVDETQALMLQNTETLARLIRPDLFDEKGRPIRCLLTQAVRAKARHKIHTGKGKKQKENTS